jgi:DNA uptake protein ComE-like DNA-binding protein
MGWKSSLRSYFIFNKRERRGILFLSVILLLVLLLRVAAPTIWDSGPIELSEAEQAELLSVRQHLLPGESDVSDSEPDQQNIPFKPFDPNKATKDELISFGLPHWLAERTVKYRSRVQPFTSPEDLLVIYGMDTQWWEMALPYIDIEPIPASASTRSKDLPDRSAQPSDSAKRNKPRKPSLEEYSISLNEADTNALMQIPGIGSFYANNIVKRRAALGGFLSFEQLMSIYRMRDETLDALARYTFIDTTLVQRINLNTCDMKVLGMHPYLSWSQARAIVNYRKQHGVYRRTQEIMATDVIPDSVYIKIAPYLTVK